MYVWGVSLASCACCVCYLRGDHPEREIRADNDELGKRTRVLLTVNRGSCLHNAPTPAACQAQGSFLFWLARTSWRVRCSPPPQRRGFPQPQHEHGWGVVARIPTNLVSRSKRISSLHLRRKRRARAFIRADWCRRYDLERDICTTFCEPRPTWTRLNSDVAVHGSHLITIGRA